MCSLPAAVAAIGDAARNVPTMPRLCLAPGFAYAPIGRRFGIPCKYPSRHSGLDPESWAALCGVLHCTAASLLSFRANAPQGPVSAHGVTAQTRRLYHRAPLHCRPHLHGVIPGLTRNPGRPCVGYCVALPPSLLSIRTNAPQGPVSAHGVTAQTRRLCCECPA